jgi:2-polyprenyl-6-methoxyphenol hydroxylase-like FAD-dependent oxidoreductase
VTDAPAAPAAQSVGWPVDAAPRAHDVAIVGAGAVGLLLACLLAQRGVDVVVLERRAAAGERTRAIGIHPPGMRALDTAGVGAAVRRLGVPIRDGVVTCQGRELGRLAFADEPVWSLPQRETERLLEARLAELAPGALRRAVEVCGLRTAARHVELDLARRTRRGVTEHNEAGAAVPGMWRAEREQLGAEGEPGLDVSVEADGAAARLHARYVVGADGVRSTVRRLAGIGWARRRGGAEYVMGDSADTTDAPATALLRFEPAGVVESFPLPGGRRRWVAWVRRAPALLTPAVLATIVAARTGASVDLQTATDPSAFVARQRLAERFARGRIALAGDAAHEVSPIGGQGMNLGWLDAVRLDAELARALAAAAPEAPFGPYHRARRSAALRATRQAAFNMAMGAPAAGARLAARNLLVRVCAVWPLRTLLASAFTMRRLGGPIRRG